MTALTGWVVDDAAMELVASPTRDMNGSPVVHPNAAAQVDGLAGFG